MKKEIEKKNEICGGEIPTRMTRGISEGTPTGLHFWMYFKSNPWRMTGGISEEIPAGMHSWIPKRIP